jgi:geranylgeranyl pyrophosphate synthase
MAVKRCFVLFAFNMANIAFLLQATSRLFDNNNPLYGVASEGQRTLALIAEMIHTSSLLHDDVIDEATTRRNKESVNAVFGDTQAIYAGDYVLAKVCSNTHTVLFRHS